MAPPPTPIRLHVIGTSGAGKTTLAARIAERLNLQHTDVDAIHWGPNWTGCGEDVFDQRLRSATTGGRWVVSGNYRNVTDRVIADRVTTYVWLDYGRLCVTGRVVRRTFRRCLTRETLWAGNRESFRLSFFSRDSIILYSLRMHGRDRREYATRLADSTQGRVVRLRSPRVAERWLHDQTASHAT